MGNVEPVPMTAPVRLRRQASTAGARAGARGRWAEAPRSPPVAALDRAAAAPPPSCNTVSMIFFRLDSCLLKCCKKRDLVNDRVAEKK